jgi:hypothetical protein
VLKFGIDECNWHHLFPTLVKSSCWWNVLKAFGLAKGSVLFWEVWIGPEID